MQVHNNTVLTLIEGIVRIAIFIVYLSLVAQMKDIKRVFMYHGAEHKSIFCYESGLPLTVDNVRIQSRLHPRAAAPALLIVMVISILVFFNYTVAAGKLYSYPCDWCNVFSYAVGNLETYIETAITPNSSRNFL